MSSSFIIPLVIFVRPLSLSLSSRIASCKMSDRSSLQSLAVSRPSECPNVRDARRTDLICAEGISEGNGCLESHVRNANVVICTIAANEVRELTSASQVVARVKPSNHFMLIKSRKMKRDETTRGENSWRRVARDAALGRRARRIYRLLAGNSVCGVIVASPYSRGARRGMPGSPLMLLSLSLSLLFSFARSLLSPAG